MLSRQRQLVSLALAAALLLALASSAEGAPEPSSGCGRAPLPRRSFVTFQVDGVQRSALITLPPAHPGTPLPLVLMYHGAGSTGPETERTIDLTPVANRFGFVTVYPDADGPWWDIRNGPGVENADVTFTRQLLDLLESELCVDRAREYAVGGSYGGGFVTLLGCELSGRLAALATIAGLYGVEPPCRPQHPISLLEVHGTADQTVPYGGSGELHAESVASFLAQWLAFDRCSRVLPDIRALGPRVLLESWAGCPTGTTVAHVRLTGEQHVWPRPLAADIVPFDASLAVWEFFSTRTVRGDTVPARRH